ncbi:MAG: BatA domain-containing protein [Planctomycetota bacterium]
MTLLNGILALGALAFTVPLAIHLLFRSRFRTIEWGAMHLLDAVVRINRRRIQLLHLLLLLLRCLLPVLLAFCLARPLLTGFQSLPGDAPQSLVIVLDDSRSMSARDESGMSRLDRAQQDLTELLKDLSRKDEVMLIRSSRIDLPPSTTGAQDAAAQLRQTRADFGPVDLGRMMQAAVEAAEQSAHAQRRIIIASDFQNELVGNSAIESLNRMTSRLDEKSIRPVVSFWNLGSGSDQLENVSVDSIDVDSPAVVAGRTARFSAEIHNASDRPMRDVRLVWSIDGQPFNPVTISLPPRSNVTSRFSRSIDETGVHEVTVAIEHGDALLADNQRSIGVEVIREVRVVLVDGQPSDLPLQGETDFLAIALSPFAFGGEDQPDAVRTTVVSVNRMARLLDKDKPDVLVLANVDKLRSSVRSSITEFVLDGGGLIVFDGNQLQIDSYNEPWESDSGNWSLPARLDQVVGSARRSVDIDEDPASFPIGNRNTQYSPWNLLGKSEQQPFIDVEVNAYRKLIVEESSTEDSPAVELLRFANGDPLVVSAKRGNGTIVQFAVPCDIDWTNLPTRLVYLPMLQQLILDLAGSSTQTTVDVGKDFYVSMDELTPSAANDASIDSDQQANLSVELPDGKEMPLELPGDELPRRVTVSTQSGPGIYQLSHSVPLENEKVAVARVRRVVEVSSIESQLVDVDASRLASAANAVGGQVYDDLQDLQEDDRTRRYGREVWRWLLFGLLIVMIAELLVQQFALRAPTGVA